MKKKIIKSMALLGVIALIGGALLPVLSAF
jgi:hypothetical protein